MSSWILFLVYKIFSVLFPSPSNKGVKLQVHNSDALFTHLIRFRWHLMTTLRLGFSSLMKPAVKPRSWRVVDGIQSSFSLQSDKGSLFIAEKRQVKTVKRGKQHVWHTYHTIEWYTERNKNTCQTCHQHTANGLTIIFKMSYQVELR